MLRAYTDGACRISNPGICSCAWLLLDGLKETSQGYYLGPELHTNNYAEYQGLLRLLRYLYQQNIHNVVIHSDSMLVVQQVNGLWKTENKPELAVFANEARGLLLQGQHRLLHIFGHGKNLNEDYNKGNSFVDDLCNEVLDEHKEEYEKALA